MADDVTLNDTTLNDTTLNDTALADTWGRLMGLFTSRRDALFSQLQALDLTPPHGFALMHLLHGGPTRMRDMAETMSCDASYITAVADRLEELGLAERRNAPDDRRARELVLTPHGADVADRLHRVFTDVPEALRQLPVADQEALVRIARRLGPVVEPDWMPPRALRH
jgi:DNA-binding MarR family transcriptional regulator